MLFEELSETFPAEVVEPYGEVLIVPAKAFKPEWRSMLEAEGVQIYTNAYRGQVCFFLRKKASNQAVQEQPKTNVGSPEPTSSQPTSQPSQPQNIEEAVIGFIREGKTFKEIRESLGLSHAQLMGYLSHLRKKGVLQKLGWVPARRRHLKKSHLPNAISEVKPFRETNLDVKELLEVSLMLLDSHPKVVRFLLEKCMESLS
jgi:hypothetical protein